MRSCWYAYTERIKEKGNFGMKTREFSRKKIQKAWGKRQEIFLEKIFSEKSKFCAGLVAPRAAWV